MARSIRKSSARVRVADAEPAKSASRPVSNALVCVAKSAGSVKKSSESITAWPSPDSICSRKLPWEKARRAVSSAAMRASRSAEMLPADTVMAGSCGASAGS